MRTRGVCRRLCSEPCGWFGLPPIAVPHPQTFDEKQKAQDQALAKAENEIEFLRLQRQSLEEALTIVEQEHA